jgi:uncharacterized SAM-binding protein YcdF (DUF218 family)
MCERGAGLWTAEEVARANARLFGAAPVLPERIDVCVILGSRNCGYRVRRAFELCEAAGPRYVVSGGGRMESGETEAAFMRARLRELGVGDARIAGEVESRCTEGNLRHSLPLIEAVAERGRVANVVVVTAGFHVVRTEALARRVFAGREGWRVLVAPAYGPNTRPESWHLNAEGRAVIGAELEKLRGMGEG